MSKRNRHSFNKRAKEIAKKKKAEEKRARKQAKRRGDSAADPEMSVGPVGQEVETQTETETEEKDTEAK